MDVMMPAGPAPSAVSAACMPAVPAASRACSSSPPPYLLGSLADHRGLHAAFTVELVLITLAALLLLAGLATSRR